MSWAGRRLEVEVGNVAHGGHCVARADGRVVFVRHALPGERVVVEVTEDKGGSYCRADAIEVLDASADRVEPPCPLARPGGCGGCDWQHASAPAQRRLKAVVVAEQLRRLAGLETPVEVEELPGGLLGWRTRVRMVVDGRGRPGFRAHRGHRVVPVRHCPIAVPDLVEEAGQRRWTRGAELALTADSRGRVHAVERPRRGRERTVAGDGVAVERAGGRAWRVDAYGFWQVHPEAAEVFAEVVAEWAAAPVGGTAWDLYAGVGLFASVLAEQVGSEGTVLAVESSRGAVAEGRANLADLPQVSFKTGDTEVVVASSAGRPDVVVLDPPRKGAGRAVVDAVAGHGPARVVYVACDPAALARDVAVFAEHGYRLERLRAFDAFPMTHHVECLALLSR
ncbi:MAG: class I SAM-dependent RNA methyltransferase [Kutzneria sp.]|nr:class I SAM-dependent RNA methyltransferase [Kutzneria sp.]MBV9847021.1 class I SAM-dependent RNA methyltransferase [Kutzneria sp.]